MIIRIVRIVLGCIIFCDDCICRQIQEQSHVLFGHVPGKDFLKAVIPYDLTNHHPCSHTKAAASIYPVFFFGQFRIREILQEIPVRQHLRGILMVPLSYRYPFGIRFLRILVINPIIFVINVFSPGLLSIRDFPMYYRYINLKIQVHSALLYRRIYAYKKYSTKPGSMQ